MPSHQAPSALLLQQGRSRGKSQSLLLFFLFSSSSSSFYTQVGIHTRSHTAHRQTWPELYILAAKGPTDSVPNPKKENPEGLLLLLLCHMQQQRRHKSPCVCVHYLYNLRWMAYCWLHANCNITFATVLMGLMKCSSEILYSLLRCKRVAYGFTNEVLEAHRA